MILHAGLSRVSTPIQRRNQDIPEEQHSPIEELLAPRRARKRELASSKREEQENVRIHGAPSPPQIQFQLPSNAFTGQSPPPSPVKEGGRNNNNSGSSLIGQHSLQHTGTPGMGGSSLGFGRSSLGTSINVDRTKTLATGARRHRARILKVGPQDIIYSGQSFNETAVSDVGNFTTSDIIGRNYTPSAAALTSRVVRSMLLGAPSSDDAKEWKFNVPPPPEGSIIKKQPWEREERVSVKGQHTLTKLGSAAAVVVVPTEEERRNDEKSLTFEINLKTGEKMIHAMRQKNNFDRATSVGGGQIKKFDPTKWNPRGLAPKVVVPAAQRLKNEMSVYSVASLASLSTTKDNIKRSNDDLTATSNVRNGKWSLTTDLSHFEPIKGYNDTISDKIVSIGASRSGVGGSSIGGSTEVGSEKTSMLGSGASTLGSLLPYEGDASSTGELQYAVNSIIQSRLALSLHQETDLQKKADYNLRKVLIYNALDRMRTVPSRKREKKELVQNLYELAHEHRLASTKASLAYDGMIDGGHRETYPLVDPKWKEQRNRLDAVRKNIENTLCVCEPLQRDLQQLWDQTSPTLKLNVVDDEKFQSDLPMPLRDFSSIFVESVMSARKTLKEKWLPETLKLCLAHIVAFLRVVMRENKLEEERLEIERVLDLTRNASRWMPANMDKSLKLQHEALNSPEPPRKKWDRVVKPIDKKSRVTQEFVHLRDPDILFQARTPKTVAELEHIMLDSLLTLCTKDDDPKKNQARCEHYVDRATRSRSNKSNYVLNFETTKIKCERLLSCAGALMSKQIRSVADAAISNICDFFRSSILKGEDRMLTAHSRRQGTLPRQVTIAQLVAASAYHSQGNDPSTTSASRFAEALEFLDAKPVFSIIQVEVTLPTEGRVLPTITPSRSILLETSYYCIDSVVECVKDFPKFDVDTLINHHMKNWDENWKRSQRASHCRPPVARTMSVPPTLLTLSSSALQIDHPAVIEAKLIIQHCVDTTYNDAKSLLPTVERFCQVFDEREDAMVAELLDKQKSVTLNAENSLAAKQDDPDASVQLQLFHDIEFDYHIHKNKISIEYERLQKLKIKLNLTLVEKCYLPFFGISLKSCMEKVRERIDALCTTLRAALIGQLEDLIRLMNNEFEAMARGLIVMPTDANELRMLSDYYAHCLRRRTVLHSRIKYELSGLVRLLTTVEHAFHVKNMIQVSNAWSWPKKSSYFFRKNQKIIKDKRNTMATELSLLIKSHEREMKALESDVKGMRRSGSLREEHRSAMKEKLLRCRASSIKLDVSSHEINKLELILNPVQKVSDFHKRLASVNKLLKPYEDLWSAVERYYVHVEKWRHEKLNTMNAKETISQLTTLKRELKRGRLFLRKHNGTQPLQAIDQLLDEVEEFEEREAPLISLFATSAIKQKHWDAIGELTENEDVKTRGRRSSVAVLLEMSLLQDPTKSHLVEDIVIQAKKEMSASIALSEMKEAWENVHFVVETMDIHGSLVLVDHNGDMRTLLDEHCTRTDAMRGSCRTFHSLLFFSFNFNFQIF